MNYGQISENINAGEKYREVKKVYSINIVYFDLNQGDDYVYVGRTDFKGLHTETLLDLSVRQKELETTVYDATNKLKIQFEIVKTREL